MTNSPEEIKAPKWAVTVIGILAFLLVFQTGGFLYYLFHKDKTTHTEPKIIHRPFNYPIYRSKHANPPASQSRNQKQDQTHFPYPQPRSFMNDPFAEDPFTSMARLQDRMNRIFDSLMSYGPLMGNAFEDSDAFDFTPTMDLQEKGNSYVVTVDLPGLEKDKIDISVRGNLLTIQGVRKTESESKDASGGFYTQERSYGSFSRTITLPGPVDESNIKAEYQNGVLIISLPKIEKAESTRKINVV
ncbi:MAG: Hsp20/alpha crystallin family protein [Candidatus Omnitrophica bacterium]|nr:Hsp20/alpha crystallin family protein [Candidatus Omnitrophota bacterium]